MPRNEYRFDRGQLADAAPAATAAPALPDDTGHTQVVPSYTEAAHISIGGISNGALSHWRHLKVLDRAPDVNRAEADGLDDEPPHGTRRWLISCDESGIDGQRYYGFGTLWMNWQRRGDFAKLLADLRNLHRCTFELKWNKVSSRYEELYRNLVESFFATPWLSFHCLVVEKAMVKRELHDGDIDLARRKHFTQLLVNKIQRRLKLEPDREQTFRIWVDPIASRYTKADEVVEIVSNHVLAKVFNRSSARPVDKVITRDSKSTASIQLCDLLLGAVMEAWQQKATSAAKLAIGRCIADHLGWPDLRSDTHPTERKFNIWYFHDSERGPRDITTRRVILRHPLPPRRAPARTR